jgi:hypothetical protein
MGRFTYEGSVKAEFEDRILLHLQTVIAVKLRRHECFLFTWREDADVGGGRIAVWMHPGASIAFTYTTMRPAELNRRWLEALAYAANSPMGLHLVPEPEEATVNADERHELWHAAGRSAASDTTTPPSAG